MKQITHPGVSIKEELREIKARLKKIEAFNQDTAKIQLYLNQEKERLSKKLDKLINIFEAE